MEDTVEAREVATAEVRKQAVAMRMAMAVVREAATAEERKEAVKVEGAERRAEQGMAMEAALAAMEAVWPMEKTAVEPMHRVPQIP